MTEVNTTKVNTETGIKIGSDNAPKKIVEFVNLKCPYCKQWSDEKNDYLLELVNEGQVQRIIKLFDKEKPSLAYGNVMHRFVPNDETAIDAILAIYKTQSVWGQLADANEVAKYAEDVLNLSLQNNEKELKEIVAETEEANVFFVPTVVVGTEVFDQNITDAELLNLLER